MATRQYFPVWLDSESSSGIVIPEDGSVGFEYWRKMNADRESAKWEEGCFAVFRLLFGNSSNSFQRLILYFWETEPHEAEVCSCKITREPPAGSRAAQDVTAAISRVTHGCKRQFNVSLTTYSTAQQWVVNNFQPYFYLNISSIQPNCCGDNEKWSFNYFFLYILIASAALKYDILRKG